MMVCVNIELFRKLIVRKRKRMQECKPYTVTMVGTHKAIDFYIFGLGWLLPYCP